jgi:hypothetical protein
VRTSSSKSAVCFCTRRRSARTESSTCSRLFGGVGVLAEQAEHERDGGAEGGASRFGIVVPVAVAAFERGEDVEGLSGAGARGRSCYFSAECRGRWKVPGLEWSDTYHFGGERGYARISS